MKRKESKVTVVIIGAILIAYLLFVVLSVVIDMNLSSGVSLGNIIAYAIGGVIMITIIYTVYDRLKEMKGEDEDDFGKY